MNILPTPRHMMPPKLNGHIKTATPDDEAVLKNNIMAYTSSMDQLDMTRLNYVLNTKNSFSDKNFTAHHCTSKPWPKTHWSRKILWPSSVRLPLPI